MDKLVYNKKGNTEFISQIDKLDISVINSKYTTESLTVRSAKCLLLDYMIACQECGIQDRIRSVRVRDDVENHIASLVVASQSLLVGLDNLDIGGNDKFLIHYDQLANILDISDKSYHNMIVNQHDLILDLMDTIIKIDKRVRSKGRLAYD